MEGGNPREEDVDEDIDNRARNRPLGFRRIRGRKPQEAAANLREWRSMLKYRVVEEAGNEQAQ